MKFFWVLLLAVLLHQSNICAKTDGWKSRKNRKPNVDEGDQVPTKRGNARKSIDESKSRRPKRKAIIPIRKEPLSAKFLKRVQFVSANVAESAKAIAATANMARRDLKAYFSSDFEVLLLRLTTPNDFSSTKKDKAIFLETIDSFARNMDTTDESNPYRVTLRKLWAKLAEPDARTKLKSLQLLHMLLRFSQPEDAVIYKMLLAKMQRQACKKTKSKYFDSERLQSNVLLETQHLSDFVARYENFVMKRAKTFTSRFEVGLVSVCS